MIASKLIVSVDLIQCVLVAEVLVLCETCIVSFWIEFVGLFCCEVLAPASGVVPVMMLEHVFCLLIDHYTVFECIWSSRELLKVAALVACLQVTYSEVCLPHLFLLSRYVEYALRLRAVLESFLRG